VAGASLKMKINDLENISLGIYDVKDQLKQHVYRRSVEAFAAGDSARDQVTTQEALEERRQAAREAFLAGIGGMPLWEGPLNAKITGVVRTAEIRIENIVFESRSNTHVTCSMYIPDGLTAPSAAVLFVCGHFEEGRLAAEYEMVCRTIATAGLIVFAIDPLGQGERSSYYDPACSPLTVSRGTSDHEHAGAQCWPLGDGLARYFVHDIVKSVDYLCTRMEVDPERIGITGNSGGGLQTAMAMLAEPRIAAAAPATFIMSRESYVYSGQAQDAEQIWPGFTRKGFDHEDLLLAMAPKPVLVLAAQYDFFPIEGTRRTVERARRFWDLYGEADRLQLFEDRCLHKYSERMAVEVGAFFARQLNGRIESSTNADDGGQTGLRARLAAYASSIMPLGAEKLQGTASGQVRGVYPGERGPCEENTDRLIELERQRSQSPDPVRRELALSWLEKTVIAGRVRVDLNPRYLPIGKVDGLETEGWIWWSQEGLFNHAIVFRNSDCTDPVQPLVIAVWERGTHRLASHSAWIQATVSEGSSVMVLDVSGEGALTPNAISPIGLYDRFGTIHKLTTDLFFLGDSLVAMRTFDVLRAVEMAMYSLPIEAKFLQVYGEGKFGLYVKLAEALDRERRVKRWSVSNGPRSVADWVRVREYDETEVLGMVLPGMLHYFDLPDLEQWFSSVAN
jgi:hypothetical protein